MNYPLQIIDKSVTPDMAISLTTTEEPTEVLLIPFIGETAVTEEWAHVFRKVESMIEEYPEAIFASIVLVREAKHYVYPARKSTAQRRCIIVSPTIFPANLNPFPLNRSSTSVLRHALLSTLLGSLITHGVIFNQSNISFGSKEMTINQLTCTTERLSTGPMG
jgi:hypothetical protein